jgi:energy-coupling factor transporter ATP-binding protein EcfA2
MDFWPDGIALAALVSGAGILANGFRSLQLATAERVERQRAADRAERMHARELAAQIATAPYQSPFPALTHYNGRDVPVLDRAPVITDAPPPAVPSPPTFAQLRAQGLIQPGPSFPLGMQADGTLRWATWLDVYNMLVVGLSGFGKSTLMRYLACMNMLNSGRLVIIDPHGESGDESLLATLLPLERAFLCKPATTPAAARAALHDADTIMQDRLHGRSTDLTPILVIADEFNEIMTHRSWEPVAPLAANYFSIGNKSGRKKRCYGMVAAQIPLADQLGGSEVRDSFVAQAVFRSRKKQAQLLDFEAREKAEIKGLEVGVMYFQGARDTEPTKLYPPNTTPADGAALATELATWAANIVDVTATTVANSGYPSVAEGVSQSSPNISAVSPEQKRALDLFIEHKSMARVVAIMDGVDSTQGSTYQKCVTRRSADVAAAAQAMAARLGQ